ncbi:hypothetical protein F4804DRAFT_32722 [Jackrogersella minutella]|nr:hypothetical protein F4804DRAFT_32722 [Jackrogersella minutella]
MVSNEYIPYESVMNKTFIENLQINNHMNPRWATNLPQSQELFYPGHRFDKRLHFHELNIDELRKTVFSMAHGIFVARRDLEQRIKDGQQYFINISTATDDICQLSGVQLHHQLVNIQSGINEANNLVSLTAEVCDYARELMVACDLPPSSSPWEPNWEGPLMMDLELLAQCWSQLADTWLESRYVPGSFS